MARHSSFPTVFDDCKSISISFLKQHGYLQPGRCQGGTITWSRNGVVTSRIRCNVYMHDNSGSVELSYSKAGKNISYFIQLATRKSNLGKGLMWFFVCPDTAKYCRKLYFLNDRFVHREAVKGCFYEKQLYSHKTRNLIKLYDMHFIEERVYTNQYKKYFKPTYAGKPTKKMLKMQKQLDFYNRVKDRIPSEEELLLI